MSKKERPWPHFPPKWESGAYYRCSFEQYVSSSLDGFFSPPLLLPKGTYFVCEEVNLRPPVMDGSQDALDYVIVKCLDPRDPSGDTAIRIGMWPGGHRYDTSRYEKVINPLLVLALASTGLARF